MNRPRSKLRQTLGCVHIPYSQEHGRAAWSVIVLAQRHQVANDVALREVQRHMEHKIVVKMPMLSSHSRRVFGMTLTLLVTCVIRILLDG